MSTASSLGIRIGLGLAVAGVASAACTTVDDVEAPAAAAAPARGLAAAPTAGPGGGAPDVTPVATYRVPLPADLAPLDALATFPLAAARAELTADRVAIVFTLPAGLLGVDAEIRLEGARSGDTAIVDGPLGAGTCRLLRAGAGAAKAPALRCALAYRPLVYSVDLDAVARYWQGRGDPAIDGRLIVSSLFDEDPLGVLDIAMR